VEYTIGLQEEAKHLASEHNAPDWLKGVAGSFLLKEIDHAQYLAFDMYQKMLNAEKKPENNKPASKIAGVKVESDANEEFEKDLQKAEQKSEQELVDDLMKELKKNVTLVKQFHINKDTGVAEMTKTEIENLLKLINYKSLKKKLKRAGINPIANKGYGFIELYNDKPKEFDIALKAMGEDSTKSAKIYAKIKDHGKKLNYIVK
jgi:hypothetical protein